MDDESPDQPPKLPRLQVVQDASPQDPAATQATAQPSRSGKDPLTGLTEKQESFAQYVVREGATYADAYRRAYDCTGSNPSTIYSEAAKLAKRPHIATRMSDIALEIHEENRAQRTSRGERIIRQLENLMLNAQTDAAKIRAAELLGKTIGLYRDVVEDGTETNQSIAELQAEIERIMARKRA